MKSFPSPSISEFKGTKQQCLEQMKHVYTKWFEEFEKQEKEKQKRDIDVLYGKFKIAQKTMKPSAQSDDFTSFVVGYMFRGKEFLEGDEKSP